MITKVLVRHSDGTIFSCFNPPCHFNGVYQIHSTNTITLGRCYTLEFLPNITFSNLDNVVLVYKGKINIFAHGRGQEIGFVANFFPVQPQVFQLSNQQKSHVSLEAMQTITEEYLGCNASTLELQFYKCAKVILSQILLENEITCTLPMISYLLPTG